MPTLSAPLIGCTTYRLRSDKYGLPLYALRPAYVDAVRAAGGIPLLIPLGLAEGELQAIFARIDGLLLPGGGDLDPALYGGQEDHPTVYDVDPDRDRVEFQLIRWAVDQDKPLLAICRGLQAVNVALGGSLWEDVDSQLPDTIGHNHFKVRPRRYLAHEVAVTPDSRLARQMGSDRVRVNSLHHQGVRRLAPALTAVAATADGLVEGVEIPDHPYALAVQWHPEDLTDADPAMRALFRGLVLAAAGAPVAAGG